MKMSNDKITRYNVGEFYLDVVEKENMWEAWLQHSSYRISAMVFRLPNKGQKQEGILNLIHEGIQDYKRTYWATIEKI